MPKNISVGQLCESLATLAGKHRLRSLSGLLKMAANEAYENRLWTEQLTDDRIGVWDWDVGNDLNFTNPITATFFGLKPHATAKGLPNERYTALVHPHDAAHFSFELDRSVREGGPFFSEYRVVVDGKVRWLRADGNCTVDRSGRPIRMLGSLVDISREKPFELAP